MAILGKSVGGSSISLSVNNPDVEDRNVDTNDLFTQRDIYREDLFTETETDINTDLLRE